MHLQFCQVLTGSASIGTDYRVPVEALRIAIFTEERLDYVLMLIF